MPINTREMSLKEKIPEEIILARLGIRAYVSSYKSAYLVYKKALMRDKESTVNRKVEYELLRKYTNSFWRALFAYKIAPWNSADKEFFFHFAFDQVKKIEEARKLLECIPLNSPYETKMATCKLSEFYFY